MKNIILSLASFALVVSGIPLARAADNVTPRPTVNEQVQDQRLSELAVDQFDIKKDVRNVDGDRAEVRQDRAVLRTAINVYIKAVTATSVNSALAKDAKANVTKAQLTLHHDIGDLSKDVTNIRPLEMEHPRTLPMVRPGGPSY